MANQFGEKVRQLREKQNLLLRQVAPQLDMDTPLLSKIERGERMVKKELVAKLCDILNADKEELLTLWLADQVYDIVKDEDLAFKAMDVANEKLKSKNRKNIKK